MQWIVPSQDYSANKPSELSEIIWMHTNPGSSVYNDGEIYYTHIHTHAKKITKHNAFVLARP